METSEALRRELWQAAEVELVQLTQQMQALAAGDLKGLEATIQQRMYALGRQWMASVLSSPAHEKVPAVQREGECGHQQHLVGSRPKQVLTLVGQVTFHRPYYQCVFESPQQREEAQCTHGEAPADALWGVQGRRTTAGVQQTVGYMAAQVPLEAAAETFRRLVPLEMSARQVLNLIQPLGEQIAAHEDEQVQALWQQARPRPY